MAETDQPSLFTREVIVFKDGVENADITEPVFVMNDQAGNHALTDGNHRSYRAYLDNKLNELPRKTIGTTKGDVSKDPDFKHISHLKVVQRKTI